MIEYKGSRHDPETVIGTGKAAEIADHHRRTILLWCEKGYLKSTRMPGPRGQYRIKIGDLIAVLTKPGHQSAVPETSDA